MFTFNFNVYFSTSHCQQRQISTVDARLIITNHGDGPLDRPTLATTTTTYQQHFKYTKLQGFHGNNGWGQMKRDPCYDYPCQLMRIKLSGFPNRYKYIIIQKANTKFYKCAQLPTLSAKECRQICIGSRLTFAAKQSAVLAKICTRCEKRFMVRAQSINVSPQQNVNIFRNTPIK